MAPGAANTAPARITQTMEQFLGFVICGFVICARAAVGSIFRVGGKEGTMRVAVLMRATAAVSAGLPAAPPARAAEGERVQVTGEVIDTWCYFSGVMGGPEAVVGSSHHTCALWCASGIVLEVKVFQNS